MNIILLSGGSGKRLWPISNDVRSKQFIKLFKKENGEYESMVQRVYGQIRAVDPEANITIATSSSNVSSIRNQLGENVAISVEPCRRDTCPAIYCWQPRICMTRFGSGKKKPSWYALWILMWTTVITRLWLH